MKKLTLIVAGFPGVALAHGAHAPVPGAAHGMAHSGIGVGLALIVIAGLAAWAMRVRS